MYKIYFFINQFYMITKISNDTFCCTYFARKCNRLMYKMKIQFMAFDLGIDNGVKSQV